MKVASSIEPGFGPQSRHVNNERVSFPVAAVPTHPRGRWRLLLPVHTNDAVCTRVFVRHQDVLARALYDLKRERHVVGARDAGHVALHLWIAHFVPFLVVAHIGAYAILEVLLLFSPRLRFIRNLSAFDNALAG